MGDHEGRSLFDLQAPTTGSYRLSCDSDNKAVLTMGGLFSFGSVLILILALALALPLTGIIGYLVHRSRDLKRLARKDVTG